MDGIYNFFNGIANVYLSWQESIANNGFIGTIENFTSNLFDFYTDLFFKFIDSSREFFIAMGSKAISVFSFDFTDNFFVCIIGFIFGFFILKFVLGKVFDLVGRWLDPM